MSSQVQFRRGTTTQNNAFTGAAGELSVDSSLNVLRLHDGTTAGGNPILSANATQTALNKTFSTGSYWQGTPVALAYGGTGSNLTANAGSVAYSTSNGLALTSSGTSGQILVSGGIGAPTWVSSSSISAGSATNAVTATNIQGGSAGQLVIQQDVSTTTFITAGAAGTFLKSAGAGYAPTWATGQVTFGSTSVALGNTGTDIAGLTTLTMSNGSYGSGTIGSLGITGSGPWTVTITGISSTTGIMPGQNITAAAGTGSLFGGTPTSVVVASIVSSTSITVTVTGGTTPTVGSISSITTFGYLQVPVGGTAQRPWVPATGMIRYNSDQVSFEGYSSGAWSSLGGVSSVDKYTYIRAETSAGASNGELEFFAKNSAGNAALKVAGMNYSRFLEATGTVLGTQTTQNLFNTVATTLNIGGAATIISLGAGSGTTTVNNNMIVAGTLTVNGATTYVTGNNTVYTDNMIELHAPTGGVGGTWSTNDGKDIGIRMHYYNSGDQNAALIFSNDENNLEFYKTGSENGSGDFVGTAYGTYKGKAFNHQDWVVHDAFSLTTSGITPNAIYTFPTSLYRSGEFKIQTVNGSAYRISTLMFVHDGTNVTLSENYADATEIQTAATNTTFTASIATGALTIYATVSSGNSAIKGAATLITV